MSDELGPDHTKIAFALAGAGSVGAVQTGMIVALIAAGIAPDLIV